MDWGPVCMAIGGPRKQSVGGSGLHAIWPPWELGPFAGHTWASGQPTSPPIHQRPQPPSRSLWPDTEGLALPTEKSYMLFDFF